MPPSAPLVTLVRLGLLLALLAPSALAQTFTENGDAGATIGSSQMIGPAMLVEGDLDGVGSDADVYGVSLAAGETLFASLCRNGGITSIDDALLFVLDAAGAELATVDDSGRCLSDTYDPEIGFTAPSAGTYYLAVCARICSVSAGTVTSSGSNGEAGDTYTVSIARLPRLHAESGDAGASITTAQAAGAPSGQTVLTGTIDRASDADMFALTFSEPAAVNVSLCNNGGSADSNDLQLFAFDSARSLIVNEDDTDDSDFCEDNSSLTEVSFIVSAAGTYYVGVCAFSCSATNGALSSTGSGADAGDAYALAFTVTPALLSEAGDTGATADATAQTANALGGPGSVGAIVGTLRSSSDADVYAVTLEAGTAVTVSVCEEAGFSDEDDTVIFLFDETGVIRGFNDESSLCPDSKSSWSALTYLVPATGTYYVGICAFGCEATGNRLTGSGGTAGDRYALSLSARAVSAAFAENGDAGATTATSQEAGTARLVTGSLASVSDVDVYALDLRAGEASFSLCGVQSDGGTSMPDSELFLLGANGTVIVQADDECGNDGGYETFLTATIPAAGTYYIAVCARSCSVNGNTITSSGEDGIAGATYQLAIAGSALISVAGEGPLLASGPARLSAWPNPSSSGHVQIHLEASASGQVRIDLHDLLGRQIGVVYDGIIQASSTLTMPLPTNLPNGTYLVRATGVSLAETIRVTIAR